ncbi:MAG: RnfABCDGE type electron transport complex subunit D [Bacteroidaceae bacterium]|nr:RnfABCDGE type electron transport complex subunit D [Bacteroidaceae bacterium]
MSNKLKVSLSPHVHSGDSVRRNMDWVVVALLPAMLWSFYVFGLGAVIVTATSVASCILFEWAINKFILRNSRTTISDGSAIVTGLLLAFNLPSNLPLYIIIIGALVAMGIGKMPFGGLGNNIFNPALVGRVFLLISFPVKMTTWPVPHQYTAYSDAVTAATPLADLQKAGLGDLFFGNIGGSLGEVSVLLLLVGFVILLIAKVISWHIPVSILCSAFVFSVAFYLLQGKMPFADICLLSLKHLCAGGMMLGAIFMATDYVTSPMTHKGMVIYGLCIGFLVVCIRLFGSYPEGMSFAILIMNGFTPLINNACKPKRFAKEVKK